MWKYIKENRWIYGMILIGFFYLVFEFSFNAMLLDTAGGIPTKEKLDLVELYGRIISAAGLSILVFSGLRDKSLFKLLLITALFGTTMFFGQKMAIDYVVNQSSAEERITAEYMTMLKNNIIAGQNIIDGVAVDNENADTPTSKAFLATMGGMVALSSELTETAKSEGIKSVRDGVAKKYYENMDDSYKGYLKFRNELHKTWKKYREASREYQKTVGSAGKQANDIWVRVNSEADQSWGAFLDEKSKLQKSAEKSAPGLNDQLYKYFSNKARCRTQRCVNDMDARYRQAMINNFGTKAGRDLSPLYWTEVEGALEKIGKTFWYGGQINVSTFQDSNIYTGEDLVPRIIELKKPVFKDQSGFDYDISSKWAYLDSEGMRKRIIKKASGENIRLVSSWQLNGSAAFVRAAKKMIINRANQEFKNGANQKYGLSISAGKSWKRFVADKKVQARIKSKLSALYVKGISMDYSEAQFKRHIIDAKINDETKAIVRRLTKETDLYADGEKHAGYGKDMFRAILVPPVALSLSLFFGLFNLAMLMFAVLSIVFAKKPWLSTARIMFASTSIALILILPFIFAGNDVANSDTYAYLFQQTASNSGVFAYAFEWIVRIQPIVYPVGSSFLLLFSQMAI